MLYPDWLVIKLELASIAGSRVLFSKSLISSNLEIVGFLGAFPMTSRILALRVITSFLATQLTNHWMMLSTVSFNKVLVTVVIPA